MQPAVVGPTAIPDRRIGAKENGELVAVTLRRDEALDMKDAALEQGLTAIGVLPESSFVTAERDGHEEIHSVSDSRTPAEITLHFALYTSHFALPERLSRKVKSEKCKVRRESSEEDARSVGPRHPLACRRLDFMFLATP